MSRTFIYNTTTLDTRSGRPFQCQDCNKSFSVTVGTIFHNTKLDLRKWFWIISLMINAKKGIFHNTKLDLRKWFWIISLMINAKKGISSQPSSKGT